MDQGLVFCTEMGTPLDASDIRRVFARVARRTGIDPSGVVPSPQPDDEPCGIGAHPG